MFDKLKEKKRQAFLEEERRKQQYLEYQRDNERTKIAMERQIRELHVRELQEKLADLQEDLEEDYKDEYRNQMCNEYDFIEETTSRYMNGTQTRSPVEMELYEEDDEEDEDRKSVV